ncbi:MAG: ABC transporter ATP-binding protein [Anaerolineaceae bacterium]
MLIELKEVKKIYHTPAGHFTALNGVTLSIGEGEFVSIVGKSGSGKTTLINLVTGIDDPTSGEVYVGDTPVHTLKESDKASWRGSNIGIVFQFFQLLPTLTVLENVMLPMGLINRFPVSEHTDRAMALLELVNLTEYAHQLPSMLSGGLQQKAAIARALANDPPIIATDEPTGNLDSKSAESVMVLFENLVQQGKTILMVTHDPDLAKRAARIIEIVDGKIANNK